ncbi:IS630 family transposase [Xenorhabdus sp. SF857]|uniref:IS630 family transposase n=1 Tax=Xenorhabdus bakwenae TaxID=3026967 RepID=UPI002557CFBF|nr:IS630 family transposase [Xenorhabdus sp. SF857]WFQ81388.1 IS630 family transposase [Xenorhabdus sp. SF857]WFQ81395.1 IS630 family transposase [Xenorhabdus sp. SF857]WFQ81400.1 IS630 family transposase [Xenorhabdus sp. SF857]WFQ81421.1 IS630 family transposase [Xenorhabdus sp. SF857]WFQ81422.1 IS630 family transposase [Xenorhabdus sp. SF857]
MKKTLKHPRADPQLRQAFVERISGYKQEGKPIVYLDESGFAQSMPRIYGYSEKGQRCFGTQDWHAKGRINVIGAILENTFITLSLFTGNINADVFHAWVTQDLLPKLPHGAVIVMDNARFHKRLDTIQAIAESQYQLEWLPAYSPDLNPIEHKWGGAKAIRRQKRCSVDEVFTEHIECVRLC